MKQKLVKSLSSGREHELKITGVTHVGDKPQVEYKTFHDSIQEVIKFPPAVKGKDGMPDEVYNPADPTWGETSILFAAVKKHLPKRPGLRLYNAIDSALDIYHGPDLFFQWDKVRVTIDLSLREKEFRHSVDLTVNLEGMDEEAYDVLGMQIADILKNKREYLKRRKKQKQPHKVSDPD